MEETQFCEICAKIPWRSLIESTIGGLSVWSSSGFQDHHPTFASLLVSARSCPLCRVAARGFQRWKLCNSSEWLSTTGESRDSRICFYIVRRYMVMSPVPEVRQCSLSFIMPDIKAGDFTPRADFRILTRDGKYDLTANASWRI